MIGWLIAVALYALGANVIRQGIMEFEIETAMVVKEKYFLIFLWPVYELYMILFDNDDSDGGKEVRV